MTRHHACGYLTRHIGPLLCCLAFALCSAVFAQESAGDIALDDRDQVKLELDRAARLYRQRDFTAAAVIYKRLSESPNADQAAWALELYGVCLEQQADYAGAIAAYDQWLQRYAGSEGELRVQQRRAALVTASAQPRAPGRRAARGGESAVLYGTASLMYRGLRTKIEDGDSDTPISSLAGDIDVSLRARTGSVIWRGRASGGYLGDQTDWSDSQGRVGNLWLALIHEPSGAQLTVGRQRTSENGIYGYFDGAAVSYPVFGEVTVKLLGGALVDRSEDTPSSDHKVYSVAAEYEFPGSGIKTQLYGMEQTFEGITERRAVGGEVSWFNDFSHYLLIADYDIKFKETNNLMFNGSWDIGADTNLSASLGYQRSPFLSASNALIGEYGLDLDQLARELNPGEDIYDAAMDRTSLSRYASLVANQRLTDRLRIIGEVYYYDLSDLPQYDPLFHSPDSDTNTTYGLQFLLERALFDNDILSTGVRYTAGDFADSTVLYADEKLRFDNGVDLTLRLVGAQRSPDGGGQDAYTVRPSARIDWYITPELLLDTEFGYEYLQQDFASTDIKVHQGFIVLGVHRRF